MWRGEAVEKEDQWRWHGISQTHHMLFQNSQTIKKEHMKEVQKNVVRGIEEEIKGW